MSLGLTRRGGGMVGETGLPTNVGLSLLFVSREKGERKENAGIRCVLGKSVDLSCLLNSARAW